MTSAWLMLLELLILNQSVTEGVGVMCGERTIKDYVLKVLGREAVGAWRVFYDIFPEETKVQVKVIAMKAIKHDDEYAREVHIAEPHKVSFYYYKYF